MRVGILIAVPVLCLILLYAFWASITLGNALSQTRAISVKNQVLDPITTFQQDVAAERGVALLFLGTPQNTASAMQLSETLGKAQSTTDKAAAALTSAVNAAPVRRNLVSPTEATSIANLGQALKNLSTIRDRISGGALSLGEAMSEYDQVINTGFDVEQDVLSGQANARLVTQSIDLITLEKGEQAALAEQELLAGDMAGSTLSDGDRFTLAAQAGLRQQLAGDAAERLNNDYGPALTKYLASKVTNGASEAETVIANTPWQTGQPTQDVTGAEAGLAAYTKALGLTLNAASAQLQREMQDQANTVRLQLLLAAGLGLLGVLVSVALSLIVGRSLVRQLWKLRDSALELANLRLPSVIRQLRAGQSVDVADYAPAQVTGSNEIDQVEHAFGVVRQTAVQVAVDEARLRRGISDVFRNLAGRSQSLLHRQLTLLDAMERRATEPEELEDLFRIDHLTTRMRRHAEGLIILSGESPARGWRQPVPLVDVLRAAVAEVEDYTRIRVLSRTNAAVAGHAVADVIHLLAELAENATVFSPPNTPVRMQGDIVGRGFAIEIEDRGLGISPARLEEINANLASPPQFDLSGSDRLGLFIAGQLAQRHDIKIALRPSVYGGTTAVVLLPTNLVVAENTFERDQALTTAPSGRPQFERIPGGRHAALSALPAGPGNGAETGFATANGLRNGNGLHNGSDHARPAADGGSRHAYSPSGTGFTFGPPGTRADDAGGLADRVQPGAGQPSAAQPEPFRFGSRADAYGAQSRGVSDDSEARAAAAAELAELGLPVRIRQASLAPQLRDTAPAAELGPVSGGFSLPAPGAQASPVASPSGTSGPFTPAPPAAAAPEAVSSPASPEAARSTVSALQRGWQLGRRAGLSATEQSATAGQIEENDHDAAHDAGQRDEE